MASDFDSKQAPNLFRALMARFGSPKNARDSAGVTQEVTIAVVSDGIDLQHVENGRNHVLRTRIGVLTENDVNDEWQFDVFGDDRFWAVDRDGRAIMRYASGMFMVPVIREEIVARSDREYRDTH